MGQLSGIPYRQSPADLHAIFKYPRPVDREASDPTENTGGRTTVAQILIASMQPIGHVGPL